MKWLGTLALVVLCLVVAPSARALDETVEDAIAQVKSLTKQKQFEQAIAKLKLLSASEDPRVTKLILALTKSRDDRMAIAAYGCAAKRSDSSVLKMLKAPSRSRLIRHPAIFVFVGVQRGPLGASNRFVGVSRFNVRASLGVEYLNQCRRCWLRLSRPDPRPRRRRRTQMCCCQRL